MTEEDAGAQIIHLPTATEPEREAVEDERELDALGVRHERDRHGHNRVTRCWHEQHAAKVDGKGRRCYCGGCGAERDPYEVLQDVASRNEQIVGNRRRLKREVRYLVEKVERLKADERNAKARIRRAKAGYIIERRGDGWPLCPECGEDSLEDRTNPLPMPNAELWCRGCRKVTMRKGRAA